MAPKWLLIVSIGKKFLNQLWDHLLARIFMANLFFSKNIKDSFQKGLEKGRIVFGLQLLSILKNRHCQLESSLMTKH